MPYSRTAIITFLDNDGGLSPDQSLPGGGYPSTGPVRPGRPVDPNYGMGGDHITTLPVFPFDPTVPDNSLPGGGTPDNDLPRPGRRYVVKWLACYGLILVPDNELPATPEPK